MRCRLYGHDPSGVEHEWPGWAEMTQWTVGAQWLNCPADGVTWTDGMVDFYGGGLPFTFTADTEVGKGDTVNVAAMTFGRSARLYQRAAG